MIRRLHDLGRPVVCVESSEDAPGVPVARSKKRRIPVIVGDSTKEETLRAAGVDHCRALLAVTSDDVTNLETGLEARELRQDLRLVLRIGDDDLAGWLQREFDIGVSRSVSYLAAPAFAAAMLQREVLGTLAVGRRVLLIAEVPIKAGSPLLGFRIADVHEPGTSRVMALRRHADGQVDWSPQADRMLEEGDQLIAVATRTGLGQILASSVSEDHATVG